MDNASYFFGYDTAGKSNLIYFDVECLLDDGESTEEMMCPNCYRSSKMIVYLASMIDEKMAEIEHKYPVDLLSLMCGECGHIINPSGLIVKNETTNEMEEIEIGDDK